MYNQSNFQVDLYHRLDFQLLLKALRISGTDSLNIRLRGLEKWLDKSFFFGGCFNYEVVRTLKLLYFPGT